MLLALLTAPALLGFASTPRGVADPGDGGCTDTWVLKEWDPHE